jgi:nitrite reductase/ring-hydroxylating ferredoxin subunit
MSLTPVAVYTRTIHAGLTSIWENVLDWAHLPWLHGSTFSEITVLTAGPWGWRARVGLQPASARHHVVIEVRLDRPNSRYLALTAEGQGKGTEIWTALTPVDEHRTDIEVGFFVPRVEPAAADAVGRAFTELYARLWDEDEAMMTRRERLLAAEPAAADASATTLTLGRLAALRARLPLVVEIDGRAYRVVDLDGDLAAHATVCPHMLGPLEEAAIEGACVRCPWHGYRFDVRSGRCTDDKRLRLAPAPRVAIDGETTDVRLTFD